MCAGGACFEVLHKSCKFFPPHSPENEDSAGEVAILGLPVKLCHKEIDFFLLDLPVLKTEL